MAFFGELNKLDMGQPANCPFLHIFVPPFARKSLSQKKRYMYIFKTYYDDQLQKEHTYWKQSNQYSRILSNNKQVFTSIKLPDNAVWLM